MIRVILSFLTRHRTQSVLSDQKTGAPVTENSNPASDSLPTPPPSQQNTTPAPAKVMETELSPEKIEKPINAYGRSSGINGSSASEYKLIQDMEKQIDTLRRENAYLRKQIAAFKTDQQRTAGERAHGDVRNPDTAYDDLLAAYALPKKTAVSAGGWKREMPIIYSRERDAFCNRFRETYTNEERSRFAEAIRLLAQEGAQRSRRSLKTKILRRELPGTPRDANYSRASHELRFTWKQTRGEIGDALQVFNVYKHRSGGGSLPDIK